MDPNKPANQHPLSIQFREVASGDVDIHIKPQSDIEVNVRDVLPDSDDKEGNTMRCIQNAVLERFGHNPHHLNEEQRKDLLKEVMPNVKNFHGRLPKQDRTKADSPITQETYWMEVGKIDSKGNPIIDPATGKQAVIRAKAIKLKMVYQIDIIRNGKNETIELVQYLKTRSILPENLAEEHKMAHAKRAALLEAKIFRKLHKKALLGKEYHLDTGHAVNVESLITQLLKSSSLKIRTYGDPELAPMTQNLSNFKRRRENYQTLGSKDGIATDSAVHLRDGGIISFMYNPKYDIKKRKIKHFKEGDLLPDGTKAASAMTKFIKCSVNDNSYGKSDPKPVAYGLHLYNQGNASILLDDEGEAYEKYTKTASEDIKNTIENEEIGEVSRFREYQKTHLENHFTHFNHIENNMRSNLVSPSAPELLLHLFDAKIGKKIRLESLSEKYQKSRLKSAVPTAKEIVDREVQKMNSLLEVYRTAAKNTVKAQAFASLESLYNGLNQMKNGLKKLENYKNSIEIGIENLRQLGPANGKTEEEHNKMIQKNEETLRDVNQRLSIYAALNEPSMNQVAQELERNTNLRV